MRQTYPLLFALGTLAGLGWLLLMDPRRRTKGSPRDPDAGALLRLDAGLVALATGLLGARLGYVAAHAAYFANHFGEAFLLSAGGLSWVGGALGAVTGVAALAALRRSSAWALADALAIPAALLAAASWTGCLLDGCGFGRPLPTAVSSPFASDFFDSRLPRWPTQVLGALACFSLALGLLALEARGLRPGLLACLTLTGLGLTGLALSFARGDPLPVWGGLRLDAVGAAVVAVVGLGGIVLRLRSRSA
jgi:prolipoprotein diacylglyceryltransferase